MGITKSMLKPLLIALVFIAAAPIASAQQHPSSMLEKRVTFTLPAHWKIHRQLVSARVGAIEIFIPHTKTEKTPHSATVEIEANIAPAGVTIKEVGDKVYEEKYPD